MPIVRHEQYCPSCDRRLDCRDYLESLGVFRSVTTCYCPACLVQIIGLSYPPYPPLCVNCLGREAFIPQAVQTHEEWDLFLRNNVPSPSWETTPGNVTVSCGGLNTTYFVTPLWYTPTPREPLSPEDLPCYCNNCGRRGF